MVRKIEADLIVKAMSEGFDQLNRKMDETGKKGEKANKQITDSADEAGGMFQKLQDNALELTAAFGTVTAAAFTIKKAFDMGREGATIRQTQESYQQLMRTIGASPDILREMQDAAGGTISDFELMSSQMTLLAGVGDDVARSLAENSPQLLKIARAAAKLNPALGDTAQMYESISRGIKRSSPLILDNLGIVVKVGEANERYAESLGKSVDALTAEEKQLALLNEVLRSGDNLMRQVGGNVESATDSYDRLTVAGQELAQSLKTALSPALSRAAEGLTALIKLNLQLDDILADHEKDVIDTSDSYEEYVEEMVRAAVAAKQLHPWRQKNVKWQILEGEASDKLLDKVKAKTEAEFIHAKAVREASDSARRSAQAMALQRQAIEETAEAADKQREAFEWLDVALGGTVQENVRDFIEDEEELKEKLKEARDVVADLSSRDWLTQSQKADLEEARGKVEEYTEAIEANKEEFHEATRQFLFDMVQRQLAADGLTAKEGEFLVGLAEKWGMIDPAAKAAFEGVQEAVADFHSGEDVETALGKIEEIEDALNTLTSGTHDIKLAARLIRAPGSFSPGGARGQTFDTPSGEITFGDHIPFASGGMMTVPNRAKYKGDKFGPIFLDAGEFMAAIPRGRQENRSSMPSLRGSGSVSIEQINFNGDISSDVDLNRAAEIIVDKIKRGAV